MFKAKIRNPHRVFSPRLCSPYMPLSIYVLVSLIIRLLQLSAWSLESWRLVLPLCIRLWVFGSHTMAPGLEKSVCTLVTLWGVSVRVRAKDLKTFVPVDAKVSTSSSKYKNQSDNPEKDGRTNQMSIIVTADGGR